MLINKKKQSDWYLKVWVYLLKFNIFLTIFLLVLKKKVIV